MTKVVAVDLSTETAAVGACRCGRLDSGESKAGGVGRSPTHCYLNLQHSRFFKLLPK